MRAAGKAIALCGLVALGYGWGAVSATRQLFPYSLAREVKQAWRERAAEEPSPPPGRFAFDQFGRLVGDTRKTPVPCPAQTDRTAVLLLAGQSNAANHGGQRVASEHGAAVVNVFAGACTEAASPLLGASGMNGELWTQLANALVSSGAFDRVLLAPVALGSTEIARWAGGGDLNGLIAATAGDLRRSNYRVTHVLWVQGESDVRAQTSQSGYVRHFLGIAETLRGQGIDAPIFVSIASKCLLMGPHAAENPVARAQRALPGMAPGLYAGVDIDTLVGDLDRYDDCHLAASGQAKAAAAWAQLLSTAPHGRRPQPAPAH